MFFADIGLRTASRRFFGTAVVGVVVGIPILLVLDACFGGYGHTALATGHKPAKYLGLGFLNLRMPALCEDFLHLVVEAFVDNRGVATLVQFAAVEEVAVVKRIGEDEADTVIVDAVSLRTLRAVVIQKLSDIFEARSAFGIQLERRAYYRCFLAINNNSFCTLVVSIPRRSSPPGSVLGGL